MEKANGSVNITNVCGEEVNTLISIMSTTDANRNTLILLLFLLTTAGSFALIGNAFIIFVLLKSPNLHKPSYILISGMACTDFLVGFLLTPFQIARATFFLQHSIKKVCQTEVVSNVLGFLLSGICFVMSLLISVDRYLAITLKNRYRAIVTRKNVVVAIVIAVLSMLALVISVNLVGVLFQHRRQLVLFIGSMIALATIVFYSKSFLALYQHTSRVNLPQHNSAQSNFNTQKYKRTLNTMVMTLVWLVFCYIPLLFAIYNLSKSESSKFSLIFLFVGLILFSINSCTNPLIYLLRFRDMRCAAKQVLNKLLGNFTREEDIPVNIP